MTRLPADEPPITEAEEAAALAAHDEPPPRAPLRTAHAGQAPPHDLEAEEAALGSMMLSLDACDAVLATGLTAEHYYQPLHQRIHDAISACLAAGEAPDAVTVRARLTAAEEPLLLALLARSYLTANAAAYARRVLHCSRLRSVLACAIAAADAARSDDLPSAIAAVEHLIADSPASSAIDHQPLGGFVDSEEPDHDWLIVELLERTDRLLLTGPEGGGKSTLLRQFAVMAAAGIHPFTLVEIQPLRVLLLDLENSQRHVRRALRAMRGSAGGLADDRLVVACHPQGLDLTDPTDVAMLTQLITTTKPDLVVGGPVYKLVGGDPIEEQPAKAAAMTLDRLRTAHGFALALETHQPHASGSTNRPERPYGASLWKRWPEFGLHLAEDGALRHWRGARDERSWPTALTRGGDWPWSMVVDARTLTFTRIIELVREHRRRLSERELVEMTGAPKTNIHRAIEANKAQFDAVIAEIERGPDAGF